jgi:hypothetical protein
MTKRITDSPQDESLELSRESVRPTRLSRTQKSKSSSRSRRRKATSGPGGIHQRANKRMSW